MGFRQPKQLLNMNTNAELPTSASHDHNTMLAAGADAQVSTSENVSAEINNELINADQLSTGSNVSTQTIQELVIPNQTANSSISAEFAKNLNELNAEFDNYAMGTMELYTFLKGQKLTKEAINHILDEYDFHVQSMRQSLEESNYGNPALGFYIVPLLIMNQWMPRRSFHEIFNRTEKSHKTVMEAYHKNHKAVQGID
jgi:hypothetical protein